MSLPRAANSRNVFSAIWVKIAFVFSLGSCRGTIEMRGTRCHSRGRCVKKTLLWRRFDGWRSEHYSGSSGCVSVEPQIMWPGDGVCAWALTRLVKTTTSFIFMNVVIRFECSPQLKINSKIYNLLFFSIWGLLSVNRSCCFVPLFSVSVSSHRYGFYCFWGAAKPPLWGWHAGSSQPISSDFAL